MKNELIQLAEYLEALEARIADLEQRYDILMQRSAEAEEDKAQAQLLSTLQDQVAQNTTKLNALGAALAEVNARLDDELELDDEEVVSPVVEEKQQVFVAPQPEPEPEPEPTPAPQPEPKPAPAKPVGKRIEDLKQGISLGDRFLFQRELFGQNGELMQKTLEELNKQSDFDAAVDYLDRKFPTWDKESAAYELFTNVLHRRFG